MPQAFYWNLKKYTSLHVSYHLFLLHWEQFRGGSLWVFLILFLLFLYTERCRPLAAELAALSFQGNAIEGSSFTCLEENCALVFILIKCTICCVCIIAALIIMQRKCKPTSVSQERITIIHIQ